MDVIISYGPYVLLGIAAGTLSGLLGVGGGVIVVPGFIWLFQNQGIPSNIIMHMAAGTSLAAMIVTASCSLYAHYRRGAVLGTILYLMIPWLIIGTGCGALLAPFIHTHVLKILFGILIISISLSEFFKKEVAETVSPPAHLGVLGISLGSFIIGILSGLFGLGGGTLLIPFLQYCGIGMRNAVSISVACGLVVAITGTLSLMLTGFHQPNLPSHSLGYVYLPACIAVSVGSPIFAFIGAMLHHRLHVSILKKFFSVFLLVVGLHLLT